MLDELVTLPVRVGIRVTRLWFRTLEEAVSVTSSAAGRMVGLLASRSSNGADSSGLSTPFPTTESAPEPESAPDIEPSGEQDVTVGAVERKPPVERKQMPEPEPDPVREAEAAVERTPPVEPGPAPEPAPEHVSEEPELVEEFAEPGAALGAGAEIHIDPPWDGYEQMSAKQVISRFATADPAELAAVQLYEGSHRRRRTILNAVERELRNANGSRSRQNDR